MPMKKVMPGGMAVIAVCAAGLLAAGCGGSSSAPPAAAAAPATTAPTTPASALNSAPAPSATADQYAACLAAGTCTAQQMEAIATYSGITDKNGTNGCLAAGSCTPSQQQDIYHGYQNGDPGVRLPGQPDQFTACMSAGTCNPGQMKTIAQYNGITDGAGTNGCLVGGNCTAAQQQDIYHAGVPKLP